jgi:RNA polymerase sigma-70 factor (ECF subfamily)
MGAEHDATSPGIPDAQSFAGLAANDPTRAAELILRSYGREIMSFIGTAHRSEADADEVFSLFAEAIWRSARTFEARSSVRTWCYAVARKVSLHFQRDTHRRVKRFRPIGDDAAFVEVEQRIRTETLTYLRTAKRDRLVALRDALPERDRALLVLRVDRRMSFRDIAVVLDGSEPSESTPSAAELSRSSARLRKQFQIVKDRLRASARQEGLLGSEDDLPRT